MPIDTKMLPTEEEMRLQILATIKHTMGMEYFAFRFGINPKPDERPHDITGVGNKFSWEVIKGLALQYRPKVDFDRYILPSLEIHRQQYHHRIWNGEESYRALKPSPDDMRFSAIDAIIAQLEDRPYNSGRHSYDEAELILGDNPPHRIRWIREILPFMEMMPQPRTDLIVDIHDFPNISIPKEMYDAVVKRAREAISMLRADHGYALR